MGCAVQVWPFQRSATVRMSFTWLTVMFLNPTAVHWLADEHDTALRLRPRAPDGTRMRCDAQLRPFQCAVTLQPWLSKLVV